jgi:hypothetical protein
MGAILAAYTAHNDLSVRPTAYAQAAAAEEAAAAAEQARQRAAERAAALEEAARGREIGKAALHGRGHALYRSVMAELARKPRRMT